MQGGSLEEFKNLRENKKIQVERDRKQVAEEQEKLDRAAAAASKKPGGSDPVGQPGPVTA